MKSHKHPPLHPPAVLFKQYWRELLLLFTFAPQRQYPICVNSVPCIIPGLYWSPGDQLEFILCWQNIELNICPVVSSSIDLSIKLSIYLSIRGSSSLSVRHSFQYENILSSIILFWFFKNIIFLLEYFKGQADPIASDWSYMTC